VLTRLLRLMQASIYTRIRRVAKVNVINCAVGVENQVFPKHTFIASLDLKLVMRDSMMWEHAFGPSVPQLLPP
jgi:hypothetical protein